MYIRRLMIRRKIAGTSVSLNDVSQDMRVYQRVGSSKLIPVSGTGDGSSVRVRAIDATSSSPVTGWVSFPVSGGVWSGSLNVPQGGWYKLEARDGVNDAVVSLGSRRFGVGIVVGMCGQSNMRGFHLGVAQYPLGSLLAVEFASDGVYRRIGNINDSFPPDTIVPGYQGWTNDGTNGDGVTHFANAVSASLNVPVCVINRAVNGSSISQWQSGQAEWNSFTAALSAAGGDMEAFFWLQGETDAATMSGSTYKTQIGNIHTNSRTITGRSVGDFAFGVASLGPGSFNNSVEGDFGKIRVAQVEYALSTAGAFYLGALHDAVAPDGVHMDGASQGRNGKRWARTFLGHLSSVLRYGPRVVSASKAGNTVTLTVAHSGGTVLVDGENGAGSSLSGFVVVDSSGVLPIVSTAISGPNSITLTLASTPVGTTNVSYGLSNAPHGTTSNVTLASAVYDNQSFGSGRGMLLVPFSSLIAS